MIPAPIHQPEDKYLEHAAKVISRVVDDLKSANDEYDREKMARHFQALALHHRSVPCPSYLKGEKAKEFRDWHNEQARLAELKI